MTGNLEMLMNMHKTKVMQDANIRAAEDIGKKAEFGYFDVEFTMYGCAYLEKRTEKMNYRVSDQADDIYHFIEMAARQDIYPSKVETITLKCAVPIGTKELIVRDVKRELAQELKAKYSKEFFKILDQMANEMQTNQAKELLWEAADQLEGTFEEEKLRQFEDFMHYSYSCRKLKKEEYQKLQRWIDEERRNMVEDIVSKDIFEKTMYGIAYIEAGKINYISNAQRAYILNRAYEMEQQGIFITPIYEKTYWYNYVYRLADVTKNFKETLKRVCNQEYLEKLKKMKGAMGEAERGRFKKALAEVREQYGEDAAATMKRYGYRWSVL